MSELSVRNEALIALGFRDEACYQEHQRVMQASRELGAKQLAGVFVIDLNVISMRAHRCLAKAAVGDGSRAHQFLADIGMSPNRFLSEVEGGHAQMLINKLAARVASACPRVSDIYGDQIQVDGKWFHAERIFGFAASTFQVGDPVLQLLRHTALIVDEHDEVISADLFRESGANITDPHKVERYAHAMREYGGWGTFPPCTGRVEVVTREMVERFNDLAASGHAHELGFSRALTESDVGRRYVHLENGHHRCHAAAQAGFDIPVIDLNLQEQGKDFIGFGEKDDITPYEDAPR